MSKKVYAPGLTNAQISRKTPEDRYGHSAAPQTYIMAGHPSLNVVQGTLEDIFGPVVPTDLVIPNCSIVTAQIAEFPKNSMTIANWNAIRDGKWTIEQLLSLIYASDLPAPASKKKEDLISLLMTNTKQITS